MRKKLVNKAKNRDEVLNNHTIELPMTPLSNHQKCNIEFEVSRSWIVKDRKNK